MQRTLCLTALLLACAAPAWGWGDDGHELVNAAAAAALPDSVPACLHDAQAGLTYLGPEPDRWRYNDLTEMNKALAPDHFLDYELLEGKVDPAHPPKHRYEYVTLLVKAGLEPDHVGLAPYRVIELCQQMEADVVALETLDPNHPQAAARRRQAEQALVYVAGVLGHYVGDLGNPHHTTIQYNGWKGDNPEGFATDRGTHARFESVFVHRVLDRFHVRVESAPRDDIDYGREIWKLIKESNDLVKPLYRLDRDGAFAEGHEDTELGKQGLAFAESRMAAAATLLRDMWVTACRRGKVRARPVKIRDEVRKRLFAEGIDVWVDVSKDLKVKLVGRLDDPARARRAFEIAKGVPGVKSVRNALQSLY